MLRNILHFELSLSPLIQISSQKGEKKVNNPIQSVPWAHNHTIFFSRPVFLFISWITSTLRLSIFHGPHPCPFSLNYLVQLKGFAGPINPIRILNKCLMMVYDSKYIWILSLTGKMGNGFLSYQSRSWNFCILSFPFHKFHWDNLFFWPHLLFVVPYPMQLIKHKSF